MLGGICPHSLPLFSVFLSVRCRIVRGSYSSLGLLSASRDGGVGFIPPRSWSCLTECQLVVISLGEQQWQWWESQIPYFTS